MRASSLRSLVLCLSIAGCARKPPAPRPLVLPERTSAPTTTTREGFGIPAPPTRPAPSEPVTKQQLPVAPGAVPSSNRCSAIEPTTQAGDALGIRATSVGTGTSQRFTYGREHSVFLPVVGTAPPPRVASDRSGPLLLELRGPARRTTREGLALTLTARNESGAAFSILRSNDGSAERMREPNVDLYVERVSDGRAYGYTAVGGRCGMMNGVSAEDVVRLTPGASSGAPFATWANHLTEAKIMAPGRYRVWVVYRLCDRARAMGMGGPTSTLPADLLLDRAVSNAIDVEVR